MANIKPSEMTPDASLSGTEIFPASDGSNPVSISVNQILAFVQAALEAITPIVTHDGSDSIMVLENGSDLKPVDTDLVKQYFLNQMWGKANEPSVDDADVIPLKDGSTEKTTTADDLATYFLAKLDPQILDISDKTPKVTPAGTDKILVVEGSTPKYTTFTNFSNALYATLKTYVGALTPVVTTNDADELYIIQAGVEKKITLVDLITHLGIQATAPGGGATPGLLAVWSGASALADGPSLVDSFATGSTGAVPSTQGVRKEMNEIISDLSDIGEAVDDADEMLIHNDSQGAIYSVAMTAIWTYINSKIGGVGAKTTPIDADKIVMKDSADSDNQKELTFVNSWDNYYEAKAEAIKLDDFAAPEDNTDLDATGSAHGLMPKLDKTKLDAMSDELGAITASEAQQIQNIGSVTISNTQWDWLGNFVQDSHNPDPAACAAMTATNPAAAAAMTHTAGTGADATTPSGAEYNLARADLDALKTAVDANNAQIDAAVVDLAALKTAVDNLKTAVDAINATQAATNITAAS